MTQWGLDTLFNPAKRHMDEEKRRLQSTREEVGDNSGGRRIDLESGRVVIRRAEDEDVERDGAQDDSAQDDSAQNNGTQDDSAQNNGTQDDSTQDDGTAAAAKQGSRPTPSAAAQRAAARRGRTAR